MELKKPQICKSTHVVFTEPKTNSELKGSCLAGFLAVHCHLILWTHAPGVKVAGNQTDHLKRQETTSGVQESEPLSLYDSSK